MASHRQESKSYFICSHVKRQSLYKLQSTNVAYKRELYFSFLFLDEERACLKEDVGHHLLTL